MPLTVVWAKAAVPKPDGTEEILHRGQTLPDYVSDFQRSTMVQIGAVRDLGQAVGVVQAAVDQETAALTDPPPPPVYPAEVPPVRPQNPVVNVDPTAVEPDTRAAVADPVDSPTNVVERVSDPADDLDKPRPADSKDAWESYAEAKGYMTRSEAESMTKAKLIADVTARESV